MVNFESYCVRQILTLYIMTKQKQRNGTLGAYVAPVCEALEFNSQGVICQSDPDVNMVLELSRSDYGLEVEL